MLYTIGISSIHGKGLIATAGINAGTVVCIAVTMNGIVPTVTTTGSYVNHSYTANRILQLEGRQYLLLATADIAVNEEITADYRTTPWFLEKPWEGFV